MESVLVAAAIIVREGRVLAAHRASSASGAGWEFPGGKVEPGETSEEALRREIAEELGMRLSTTWLLETLSYDYPTFRLVMDCYVSEPLSGEVPEAHEHDELCWLARDELLDVEWLAADRQVATLLGTYWDQIFASEHL